MSNGKRKIGLIGLSVMRRNFERNLITKLTNHEITS
jgi:6-phosphogluconate dehydrogenase